MNIPKSIFRLLLGRRLPITQGTLKVAGLERSVTIRRDAYGIPYIEAENDADAWYGLGFCQGQDRAFQLESLLRVVRGTVAEMAGPEALPIDRLSRRIGFARAAAQQWPLLDADIRLMLEAYARGIGAGVSAGGARAHEFALLRLRPTPYAAVDVLGLLKFMGFNLAANWDAELMRLKILTEDGPEALMALDPHYPAWQPVTASPTLLAGKAADRLSEDLAIFMAAVGPRGGSNSWAVAPSHTATGRPLLGNDPHLGPALPGYFYLARVSTPDWAVAGASFVGTPIFTSGHNGVAAWGMTAGMIDNTDLFLEEIGPDGRSVREGEHFVPCEIREEIIRVKGKEDVVEHVLLTPRGPIISPALEGEMGALSICATWLNPRPLRGLFCLHQVRSFDDFRRVLEQWPAVSLGMTYADTSGAVGYQFIGESPRRRKGWGTLPLPGWDPEVGWEEERVPFDDLPYMAHPPAGFVALANNKPLPDGEGPFLSVDWIDGYRLTGIVTALAARNDWDVAGMQALQLSQTSIPWQELRDFILALPTETEPVRQALALLRDWDGVLSVDSPAAAIFELLLVEMIRRIVESKAPRAGRMALGEGCTLLSPRTFVALRRISHLVDLLHRQPEGWFERPWNMELLDALSTVLARLHSERGPDPARWAWGHLRQLTLQHTFGGKSPLDRVFNRGPFPCGGDATTVSQASTDLLDPFANPMLIACLRMAIDVGNWDVNSFVLPGGQSGNPLSPHYDDQLSLWQRGEGTPIAWSSERVRQAARAVLRLEPGQA